MASYIRHSSRWWEGPQADYSDIYKKDEKKRNKSDIQRLFQEAMQNPELEPAMSMDESGNATMTTKKKESQRSILEALKDQGLLLEDNFGTDQSAPSPIEEPISRQDALREALQAETGKLRKPSQEPEPAAMEPEATAIPGAPVVPEAKAELKGTSVQGYMDKLNKQAPEGYKFDPNYLYGKSKEMWIKDDTLSMQQVEIPEGMEVVGYDQRGRPMIRKIDRNISAEKFDFKKSEDEKTGAIKSQATVDVAQSAIDTIDTLLSDDKIKYFGAAGDLPPWPAEYAKKDWLTNYDFLSAKNVVGLINEMKAQSRTGATGFGALNREELNVLKNASMKLQKGLKEEDAAKYLGEMKAAFAKIIERETGESVDTPQESKGAAEGENDVRAKYNALRASGVSAADAKKQLGL